MIGCADLLASEGTSSAKAMILWKIILGKYFECESKV